MEELSVFISNVGFPILAYIIMSINQKDLTKTIGELSTTLKLIDSRLLALEGKKGE